MKSNNHLFANWTDFLDKVKKRFGPSQFEDSQSRLFELVQNSTLEDFQSQFERLMNKVTGVTEPQLLSCETLLDAINLTKEFEARTEDSKLEGTTSNKSSGSLL